MALRLSEGLGLSSLRMGLEILYSRANPANVIDSAPSRVLQRSKNLIDACSNGRPIERMRFFSFAIALCQPLICTLRSGPLRREMIGLGFDSDKQIKVLVSLFRLVCDGKDFSDAFDKLYPVFTKGYQSFN